MKSAAIKTARTMVFLLLLWLNKTEWFFVTLFAIAINICLSPNFIVDVNTMRQWLRWKLGELSKAISV